MSSDLNEARKTMIFFLLIMNLIGFGVSFIKPLFLPIFLLGNVCCLGIQYLMDKMQHRVEPMIKNVPLAKKIDGMI